MASEEKNSSKLNNLNWILWIAIILFIGLLLIYYFNIFPLDETKKGEWGTFGDFIGGTLNPLFALFSLFAIIYTIKIQTKELQLSREELEATRKELEGSRIAQQEQSESLRLQNGAIEKQIFENTFFSLLKEVNGLLNELYDGNAVYNYIIELSNDRIYLEKEELKNKFNLLNNGVMRNYFMMLYQILKFIDNSLSTINKKTYSNIVRANSGNFILSLLAINCYSNDFSQFKEYLEDQLKKGDYHD